MASEPIFVSDGEVDPISHKPLPPPRVLRDGQPAGPLVDMIVFLFATGGTIWIAYGVFRAVCWVVRLFS